MKTLINYSKKTFIGTVDGEKIYLSAPSWDCGWYWGFGYLGNNNCHYHVDGLKKEEKYNFLEMGCVVFLLETYKDEREMIILWFVPEYFYHREQLPEIHTEHNQKSCKQ